MTSELKDIVAEAYDLFAKYKTPSDLDVCTDCCVTANEAAELKSMAVGHIPFQLLYTYNTAAKPVKPALNEFRHYLPRFLELLAENQYVSHSAELTLSRFSYYQKEEWETNELNLIQRFGLAYIKQCMRQYPIPEFEQIDSMFIMLWKAKLDLDPFLAYWIECGTPESAAHYKDLSLHAFKTRKPNTLSTGFADEQISDKLGSWRDEERTQSHFARSIEQIILNPPEIFEENDLREFSWLYERLGQV